MAVVKSTIIKKIKDNEYETTTIVEMSGAEMLQRFNTYNTLFMQTEKNLQRIKKNKKNLGKILAEKRKEITNEYAQIKEIKRAKNEMLENAQIIEEAIKDDKVILNMIQKQLDARKEFEKTKK